MTVDLRGAAYAASRISSTLKGSTKQFGWLQASEINCTTHGLCGLFAPTSGRSDGRVLHIDHRFARMQRLNVYEAKTSAMTRIGSSLSHVLPRTFSCE